MSKRSWAGNRTRELHVLQLIKDMLKKQPPQRPKSAAVLENLFFWDSNKCFEFLKVVDELRINLEGDKKALKKIIKALSFNKESKSIVFEISSSISEVTRPTVEEVVKSIGTKNPETALSLIQKIIEKVNIQVVSRFLLTICIFQGPNVDYNKNWAQAFPNFLWHVYFGLRSFKAVHPTLDEFYTKNYVFDKPRAMKNYLKRFSTTEKQDDGPKAKSPRRD